MNAKMICVLVALGLGACRGGTAEPASEPRAVEAAPLQEPGPPKRAEILAAPSTDEPVDALVRREVEAAGKQGRELLVYVGAEWCEPCKRFHDAVAAGELDATFPTLRLVEFDLDRDKDRLAAAGYTSRMIPLFAVPGADGRGTERRIQGSVKGEGAVANIVPRLQELLRGGN